MDLKTALEIIDSGQVFSCTVVTYDKNRKKGGQKRFFSQLKISKSTIQSTSKVKLKSSNKGVKNHFENATRTCVVLESGMQTSVLVSIHIF